MLHTVVTHHSTLDFLDATRIRVASDWVNIAIDKNNDIVMIKDNDPQVYVCDANFFSVDSRTPH